jgi:hypothetical protein
MFVETWLRRIIAGEVQKISTSLRSESLNSVVEGFRQELADIEQARAILAKARERIFAACQKAFDEYIADVVKRY